jgi:hypothetical protein
MSKNNYSWAILLGAVLILSPIVWNNYGISVEIFLVFYALCIGGVISAKGWWKTMPLILLITATAIAVFVYYILASGSFMRGWQF